LIGIQPSLVDWGEALTPAVVAALPEVCATALRSSDDLLLMLIRRSIVHELTCANLPRRIARIPWLTNRESHMKHAQQPDVLPGTVGEGLAQRASPAANSSNSAPL